MNNAEQSENKSKFMSSNVKFYLTNSPKPQIFSLSQEKQPIITFEKLEPFNMLHIFLENNVNLLLK